MKGEPIKYVYNTSLKWVGEKKGKLSAEGKPDILTACPPEYQGHPNIWSPEDLYIASVEVCTMTTFLYLAKKFNLEIKSYQSKAKGIAELVDKYFQFSSIKIDIKIGITDKKEKDKINKILEKIPKICLVSNSIKSKVIMNADIFIEK